MINYEKFECLYDAIDDIQHDGIYSIIGKPGIGRLNFMVDIALDLALGDKGNINFFISKENDLKILPLLPKKLMNICEDSEQAAYELLSEKHLHIYDAEEIYNDSDIKISKSPIFFIESTSFSKENAEILEHYYKNENAAIFILLSEENQNDEILKKSTAVLKMRRDPYYNDGVITNTPCDIELTVIKRNCEDTVLVYQWNDTRFIEIGTL